MTILPFSELKEKALDLITLKFNNPYKISPGGYCPIQAEGFLKTGELYYFRARGSQWSLEIYTKEEDFFKTEKRLFNYVEKKYCEWPEAGFLSKHVCIKLATKAINKYYGIKNS
jgi:hypothetical protein